MEQAHLNVLITAVAGDLGQAIVKALRLSPRPMRLHGCDLDLHGIGEAFVPAYRAVPSASEGARYIQALLVLCREWCIDVVIPASEPEMRELCEVPSFPRLPGGAVTVCQSGDWLRTFGDKLKCMQALSSCVEVVPFADASNPAELDGLVARTGFPIVVKPRSSSGSRDVRVTHNWQELSEAVAKTPRPMAQQFIDAEHGEFSVGVFSCAGFARAIAFKRNLNCGGPTWYAETSEDVDVLDYALRIVRASDLRGSANIQVRKSRSGVRLLEVNPRFSSLVAARAVCGFRDAEWAITHALGEAQSIPDQTFRTIRFRRYFHELVDMGEGFSAVTEWLPMRSRFACELG